MKKKLETILASLNELGEDIEREERVCAAELKERKRLGLQGDEAIKHYNEWMQRNGMEYLTVKQK